MPSQRKTNPGSIGIRVTQAGIEFIDAMNPTVVMMWEADGYMGEVFIGNEGGEGGDNVLYGKSGC